MQTTTQASHPSQVGGCLSGGAGGRTDAAAFACCSVKRISARLPPPSPTSVCLPLPASPCLPSAGNINQLVLKLSTYAAELHRHGGVIAEFVNPKYADAGKTTFKSSTRLECMMQVQMIVG